jgi:hypothetical protein
MRIKVALAFITQKRRPCDCPRGVCKGMPWVDAFAQGGPFARRADELPVECVGLDLFSREDVFIPFDCGTRHSWIQFDVGHAFEPFTSTQGCQ